MQSKADNAALMLRALHKEVAASKSKRLHAAYWRVHHALADMQDAAVTAGLIRPVPDSFAGTPKPDRD